MKTWAEVENALHDLRKDKYWLSAQLGIDVKVVNHWPTRKVPAKYHQPLDDLLRPAEKKLELSEDAIRLGRWLDGVPDASQRARAFIEAMAAITARLDIAEQIVQRGQPDPAETSGAKSRAPQVERKTQ